MRARVSRFGPALKSPLAGWAIRLIRSWNTIMKLPFVALMLLAVAVPAEANVRNYFTPQQNGVRLSSCFSDKGICGKAVADAFCRTMGFGESILFAREPVDEARPLDKEVLCSGTQCEAFTRIKCFSANPPEVPKAPQASQQLSQQ